MIIRLLKYAIKNILRNKFLSLSSVLVLSLLMFFINILLVMHNVSFKLIDTVNSKMSISLYLAGEYSSSDNDVVNFIGELVDVSSESKVEYKNKEKVLEEIKKQDPELVRILQSENPLPNTISISDIPLNDYEKINYIITKNKYLFSSNSLNEEIKKDINSQNRVNSRVATYDEQFTKINGVISILKALGIGLYVIIGVFVFSIAIIIYSVIGNFIYYYKNEIYITKLVGGSNIFIYGPFSIQGMIYSIISFLISLLVFFTILENARYYFKSDFSLDFLFSFNSEIMLVEFTLFLFIGGFSGFFSSKRYLKNTD